MKKTYSYEVIETRPIQIDYDEIFDYIKTDIEENSCLYTVYDYFCDNTEECILNTTGCEDFDYAENEYLVECMIADFENYLDSISTDWDTLIE